MKTFTIDTESNIIVFATAEEAAAATTTPFDTFGSQKELAELAAQWLSERLLATYNGLAGVTPVKGFKSSGTAASRIWKRIERLSASEEPKAYAAAPANQPKKAKTGKKAASRAQSAKAAPARGKKPKKATAAKNTPKAQRAKKKQEAGTPREGGKTAQVVAMLQPKNGASLEEIVEKMGWQKHTVRGFIAGAMKKASYEVESFKSDKDARTYRINP